MMARAPRNIRTPLKQRWRQFRYVCLPYVVFGLTVAATAWLWQQHAGPSGLSGRVTARRGTIAAGVAAEMLPLPGGQLAQLDLNSVVKKGDVIVMFDTSLLDTSFQPVGFSIVSSNALATSLSHSSPKHRSSSGRKRYERRRTSGQPRRPMTTTEP
ncbi:MAG: hypothetical protein IIB12_01530 [Chloroflexi bacterium]|nr:hypothetical protein [Chloroflexota bacterium]